jgi:hypothetical protein
MRYDSSSVPFPVKVVDDATGQEVKDVLWVDDITLEYAVMSQPPHYIAFTDEIASEVVKVSHVRVDLVNRVIHVNQPPALAASMGDPKLKACAECCQESTCRRIHYCAQWRTGFGEARQP